MPLASTPRMMNSVNLRVFTTCSLATGSGVVAARQPASATRHLSPLTPRRMDTSVLDSSGKLSKQGKVAQACMSAQCQDTRHSTFPLTRVQTRFRRSLSQCTFLNKMIVSFSSHCDDPK